MAHLVRDRMDRLAGVAALADRRRLALFSDQYVLLTEGWPWLARELAEPDGPAAPRPAGRQGRIGH